MTLGRKSQCITINTKKHTVQVQINKLNQVCDINPRLGEILSDFQGRPITTCYDELFNAIYYYGENI